MTVVLVRDLHAALAELNSKAFASSGSDANAIKSDSPQVPKTAEIQSLSRFTSITTN